MSMKFRMESDDFMTLVRRMVPSQAARMKSARHIGVKIDSQFPAFLGLCQAGGKPVFPGLENDFQPVPETFVLVSQFLTQVADKTSLGELVFRHVRKAVFKVIANAAQGRVGSILKKRGQFKVILLGKLIDHRQAEVLLAAEIMVKRPFGDACLAQHRIDTGSVVAVHGNQFRADLDDLRFFVTGFYLHAHYY